MSSNFVLDFNCAVLTPVLLLPIIPSTVEYAVGAPAIFLVAVLIIGIIVKIARKKLKQ